MNSMSAFARRRGWLVFLAFLFLTLAIGLAFGGKSWLLTVPAMFMLGRSYGGRPDAQAVADQAEYGVGAALAGFTPSRRG